MKRPLPFHSNSVWPPPVLLITFVIMYGMLVGSFQLIRIFAGIPSAVIDNLQDVKNIETGFLSAAAGVYAIYRVWRFHPRSNFAYLGWLRLTPWTADKPLPLGPVHLVWQDVAVVGVLSALIRWQSHGNILLPGAVFVFVYLALMTVMLWWTRRWAVCVVLGFLWPALMLPQLNSIETYALVAAIAVVICYGHRQSLRTFPWTTADQPMKPPVSILQKELQPISTTGAPPHLGWPLTVIGPKINPSSVSTRTAFWLSALFGWWSFCAIEAAQDELPPELIILFAIFAAVIRAATYCPNIFPPFNVWGRFASGRFIVPGFDKIFVTPLAAMLISIAGGVVIRRSGTWFAAVEGVVIGLIWFVLLNGGPTRKNWVLTGYLRFSPRLVAQKKAMLRQV